MDIFDLVDPEFNGSMSSDELYYGGETNIRLTDVIAHKSDYDHTHTGYATADHVHDGYVSQSDLELLEDVIDTKADSTHTHSDYATVTALNTLETKVNGKANSSHTHSNYVTTATLNTFANEVTAVASTKADASHTHSEYAVVDHSHSEYATQIALDTLGEEVNGKADSGHTHTEYALYVHSHDEYAPVSHSHNEYASSSHSHNEYAPFTHSHTEYSAVSHDHDEDYAPIDHAHADYVTTTDLNEVSSAVSGKANASHTHDDRYYTETEVDTKLSTKADSAHTHTGVYDASGAAANALTSANAYTDSKIDALVGEGASTTLDTIGEISAAIEDNQDMIDILNAAIANKANATDLTSHTGNTTIHVTANEKASWNAKSNFSGNYNDLINQPSIPSIDGLATEIYVDEAVSVKANATHTHGITDVTGLQSALDGKAAASHGTHVSYSTTAPIMDGTAAVGTAATVARSDHKHPTDTSRAAKTDFDSHVSDTTKHITSAERTNWNAGYAHSQATHAPSNAEKNQNAFSYVKVGTTSVAADSATDTLTLVAGTNVTITPDATGDSITISSTDTNTTYSAGTGISLSGTTFSNSGVRSIATGSANGTISVNTNGTSANVAVKGLGSAAYTASTAYDAAGTAQTKADAALASAKAYTDDIKNDLLNGAGAAYDTLKELGDLIDVNVDAIDALETVAASKASASDLTSHTSNKSNPHSVTLAQLGLTATAAELNTLDGITATVAELNYVDGVTSNIQTQLNGKAASSHSHSAATTSAAGFMSASDKSKLNGIANGANAYTHPTYTARTGVPTANQTPTFGGTFTVSQPVSDGTGHITAVNSRTITIPSAVATTSANGLMSKSDKSKLDGMVLATVSEVETYLAI